MGANESLVRDLADLSEEQRREVYRDLRAALGVSASEPMLPLPAEDLAAWARVYAEELAAELAKRPATAPAANAAMLEGALLGYGQPASDDFLEAHLGVGASLRDGGLPGVYLDAVVNGVGLVMGPSVARKVLPPASAAIVAERYATVMILRHAIMLEGYRTRGGSAPA